MLTAHQLNETAQYCFGDEINFLHEVSLCGKAVMIGAGPGVMALALLEEQDEEFEFDIIDVNTCHWVKTHLEAAGLLHDKIHFIHADSKTWGWLREHPDQATKRDAAFYNKLVIDVRNKETDRWKKPAWTK
jgi:hypothetical protein